MERKMLILRIVLCAACSLYILASRIRRHQGSAKDSDGKPTETQRTMCLPVLTAYDLMLPCNWTNLDNLIYDQLRYLDGKHLVMVGDSRVRDLFVSLTKILQHQPIIESELKPPLESSFKFRRFQLNNHSAVFDFHWQTYPEDILQLTQSWPRNTFSNIDLLVIGIGAWSAVFKQRTGLEKFTENVEHLATFLQQMGMGEKMVWIDPLPYMTENGFSQYKANQRTLRLSAALEWYRRRHNKVLENRGMLLWRTIRKSAAEHLELYRDHSHFNTELLKQGVCQLVSAWNPNNCANPYLSAMLN